MANPEPTVQNLPRTDEVGDSSGRTAEPPEPADGKSIKDTLGRIFNGLVEVKVVTILENVDLEMATGDGRTVATLKPFNKEVQALVTIFNLIDGDVVNVISPDLQGNTELRAFHTAQVDKSMAVLPANIAALVQLGKAIIDELR